MLTFGFDIVISFADKAISHEIIKKKRSMDERNWENLIRFHEEKFWSNFLFQFRVNSSQFTKTIIVLITEIK